MKGIELSKSFFYEYGLPKLSEEFPSLIDKIAVGLIGSGSECFGYDDFISTDHDFDPGFLIFIDDDIDEETKFKLERLYSKLPREYMGYVRPVVSPVGGSRRGVKRVSEFLKEKTGSFDGNLGVYDYLNIGEEYLAELTNGEIWLDNSKIITNIRLKLLTFPNDIKLKKLAGEILIMAQSGQYNYERCVSHNELGAARLALYEFVKAAIHTTFLINEVYMPYYKWKFRALRDLSWPKHFKIKSELNYIEGIEDDSIVDVPLEKMLISLLNVSDDKIFTTKITRDIDLIAKVLIERLKFDKLTESDSAYLEGHAYSINNKIKDNNLRNMHILSAV